jgi:hypothetical protein
MVAVPTLRTVTVFPEIVATAVFRLSYENAPVLLDDGGVRVNGETPKLTPAIVHELIVGAAGDTVNDASTDLLV